MTKRSAKKPPRFEVPRAGEKVEVEANGKVVRLTNLAKPFWPERGITKADLLQYYADVAWALIPHIANRAMVMKRYPNGVTGDFFFMKRTPSPRPAWLKTVAIAHGSEGVIDFPLIDDLACLLWVINLGCIDLNPWYARADDTDRPDYLHFDLDPFEGATWEQVVESGLILKKALDELALPSFVKTTGSRGLHIYVPIVRGPLQREVWALAKALGDILASRHPKLMTTHYSRRTRPKQRVLVDYNQNEWGRTLASIYSVRPTPFAGVSTPLEWSELDRGVSLEDFRIDNVPARLRELGDLWAPTLAETGRADLTRFSELT